MVLALFYLLSNLPASLAENAADPLTKGMDLAKRGKYQDSIAILRQAPQNPSNYYYQAYCYYQLHHEEDAKKLFSFVVDRFPGSPEAKLALDFLKRIDPAYSAVTIPNNLPAPTGTAGASQSNSSAPHQDRAMELASMKAGSMPSESRIFFSTGTSGHMMVDAMVNGHPFKCMFDTGAPGLLFGKNHLRTMGILPPQGPPTTSVRGWAGVAVPAWSMNLTVKLGNIERTLRATIQEDLDLDPLIGYSFIEGYQYEIDQKAKCMILRKGAKNDQAINSLYDVPCRIIGTKPIVKIDVGKSKAPVFIDTGAAVTIINADEAAAMRIEIPSEAPLMTASGVGGSTFYRVVNLDLKLGPIVRKEFPVHIGGHAGSCVGQDFLQGWRFTVDENKGYMRFFH